jgi:hypothetical protein
MSINNSLVLIVGKSAGGKSTSLRNIRNHEGVIFLNCEAGKELPFPNKFKEFIVTHPKQVHKAFKEVQKMDDVHTIIIDSATFLMDMYETKVVLQADDTRSAWGDYAQFWKELMQDHVASCTKNVIILAHTMDILNQKDGVIETLVKVKGSLMNNGLEAYFCNVVAAKKVSLNQLEGYENPYLNITEEEKIEGFKYVFQTKLTKETVNERIRGPINMWKREQTFIDNDAQFLLDQLHKFYNSEETV